MNVLRMIGAVLLLNLVAFLAGVEAQVSPPTVAPNGRWEIVVTSGDTAAQYGEMGQSTISTYLNVSNGKISAPQPFTTDTLAADISEGGILILGNFANGKNGVTLDYRILANASIGQARYDYHFVGTYHGSPADSNGPTITGTYTSTAANFSNGGNFVATWFPDFPTTPVTYSGALSAGANGTGPTDVPATFSIGSTSGQLNGSVSVSLTNSNGISCFAGPLTIKANPGESWSGGNTENGTPYASGVGVNIWATDGQGAWLWLIGYSAAPNEDSAAVDEMYLTPPNSGTKEDGTQGSGSNASNNGTNNSLVFYYGISGGPCDGLGGGDAPFHVVKHEKHTDRRRKQ